MGCIYYIIHNTFCTKKLCNQCREKFRRRKIKVSSGRTAPLICDSRVGNPMQRKKWLQKWMWVGMGMSGSWEKGWVREVWRMSKRALLPSQLSGTWLFEVPQAYAEALFMSCSSVDLGLQAKLVPLRCTMEFNDLFPKLLSHYSWWWCGSNTCSMGIAVVPFI